MCATIIQSWYKAGRLTGCRCLRVLGSFGNDRGEAVDLVPAGFFVLGESLETAPKLALLRGGRSQFRLSQAHGETDGLFQ